MPSKGKSERIMQLELIADTRPSGPSVLRFASNTAATYTHHLHYISTDHSKQWLHPSENPFDAQCFAKPQHPRTSGTAMKGLCNACAGARSKARIQHTASRVVWGRPIVGRPLRLANHALGEHNGHPRRMATPSSSADFDEDDDSGARAREVVCSKLLWGRVLKAVPELPDAFSAVPTISESGGKGRGGGGGVPQVGCCTVAADAQAVCLIQGPSKAYTPTRYSRMSPFHNRCTLLIVLSVSPFQIPSHPHPTQQAAATTALCSRRPTCRAYTPPPPPPPPPPRPHPPPPQKPPQPHPHPPQPHPPQPPQPPQLQRRARQ